MRACAGIIELYDSYRRELELLSLLSFFVLCASSMSMVGLRCSSPPPSRRPPPLRKACTHVVFAVFGRYTVDGRVLEGGRGGRRARGPNGGGDDCR